MSNYSFEIDLEAEEDNFEKTIILKIDFDSFDKRTYQKFHAGLIVLLIVLLIVVETLGNFLLFCLIWYEKYGMDAQKRTVTNQLFSSICISQILCNIFIIPLSTVFLILGPPESKYFYFE